MTNRRRIPTPAPPDAARKERPAPTSRTNAPRPRRAVSGKQAPTPPPVRVWWHTAARYATAAALVCAAVWWRVPAEDRSALSTSAIAAALAAAASFTLFFYVKMRVGTRFATAVVSIALFVAATIFAALVPNCPRTTESGPALVRCTPVDAAATGFTVMLLPPLAVIGMVVSKWMYRIMYASVVFAVRKFRRR